MADVVGQVLGGIVGAGQHHRQSAGRARVIRSPGTSPIWESTGGGVVVVLGEHGARACVRARARSARSSAWSCWRSASSSAACSAYRSCPVAARTGPPARTDSRGGAGARLGGRRPGAASSASMNSSAPRAAPRAESPAARRAAAHRRSLSRCPVCRLLGMTPGFSWVQATRPRPAVLIEIALSVSPGLDDVELRRPTVVARGDRGRWRRRAAVLVTTGLRCVTVRCVAEPPLRGRSAQIARRSVPAHRRDHTGADRYRQRTRACATRPVPAPTAVPTAALCEPRPRRPPHARVGRQAAGERPGQLAQPRGLGPCAAAGVAAGAARRRRRCRARRRPGRRPARARRPAPRSSTGRPGRRRRAAAGESCGISLAQPRADAPGAVAPTTAPTSASPHAPVAAAPSSATIAASASLTGAAVGQLAVLDVGRARGSTCAPARTGRPRLARGAPAAGRASRRRAAD